MSDEIKLTIIAVVASVLFSAGWLVRGWHDDAALKKADDAVIFAQAEREKLAKDAATGYESARANDSNKIYILNKIVEAYRAKDHLPAGCFIPADGLSALTSAVADANTGRPDAKLPGAAKPYQP